ncbi:MAG: hypothetical protein KDA45_03835 [Planctomycetales bacterium]|nr:hypothetical protein [Planctomycetales bacterium]
MKASSRLTPLEELMLHQDSLGYPCALFIKLYFRGRLAKQPFEEAVRLACERHPLLRARIRGSRAAPRWEFSDQAAARVRWQEGESGEPSGVDYLDIEHRALQIHVRVGPASTVVLLQIHHASCDGLGAYQFVQDLLLLYTRAMDTTGSAHSLPRLQTQRLAQRGRLSLPPDKLIAKLPRQAVGLSGVCKFILRAPVPVVPHEREASDARLATPYPAICSHQFDRETSRKLGQRAAQLGVTTNELLCARLYEALHGFRQRQALAQPDAWLRLMIPMNLRGEGAARLPAANVVSAIFLDRQGRAIESASTLLQGIHDEMQVIKRNQLGFTFLMSLLARRWLPGGIRRGANARKCNTTAVFTNVGRVLAKTPLCWEESGLCCGDVWLERTEIVPPLTAFTCAGFGATWFGDRLAIALHYDPRPFTSQNADQLLQAFVRRVDAAADGSDATLV